MGRFFCHKLTGAQASLFAEGCRQFSEDAESDNGIATPIKHPIFSWLSPQQRIHLVREVAVGLLCPNEPLPPDTMHHYAAFRAIFTCIDAALKNEVYPLTASSPKRQTPQEMLEDEKNRLLVTMAAEEGVKQLNKCNIAAVTPCDRADTVRQNVLAEAFSPNPTTPTDFLAMFFSDADILFSQPCSAEERIPSRPLSHSEKTSTFRWRLLCDAAFQQDRGLNYSFVIPRAAPVILALAMGVWAFLSAILPKSISIAIMTLLTPLFIMLLMEVVRRFSMPLCFVDFCWNNYDYRKWSRALSWLRLKMNPTQQVATSLPLLSTEIQEATYADASKHDQIGVVESIVRDLRTTYDAAWEPSDTGMDQRCIFAVCGTETIGGTTTAEHKIWTGFFEIKCRARGFLLSERGHFQERLDVFQSMMQSSCNKIGLDRGFYTGRKFVKASEFVANKGLPVVQCNTCKKKNTPQQQDDHLMTCSRCQAVWYCSAEHQREDWSKHKKICASLAACRKDKNKVKEIVQKFQT